jgi:hypothetical protein
MQNSQENGPFHIKAKLPLLKKVIEDSADPQLLPEPLEDQGRADLLGRGLRVPLAGEDQKDFFGKSRKGADQVFDFSPFLQVIHPANCSDDPLNGPLAFPVVLNDLEVLMQSRLFDSGEHRVPHL